MEKWILTTNRWAVRKNPEESVCSFCVRPPEQNRCPLVMRLIKEDSSSEKDADYRLKKKSLYLKRIITEIHIIETICILNKIQESIDST